MCKGNVGKAIANVPFLWFTISTYAPEPASTIATKGHILNGFCPGVGLGPLSPVLAYVRRAGAFEIGARKVRGMELEAFRNGEACWQKRREKNLGICCAIVSIDDINGSVLNYFGASMT